jgi:hypothetical protein
MLDPNSEDMRKELDALPTRLQTLKEKLGERGRFSDAERAAIDRIERRNDWLAVKLSDAERTGTWGSTRADFLADWNSLIVDLELLEDRLYE